MSCTLHRIHRPATLTTEFHHVIPQAWQRYWTPKVVGITSVGLWDSRQVELCPTSHRNVHFWIVQMMRALARTGSNDPLDAKKAVGPSLGREQAIAYDALTRYRNSGGSLIDLYSHGLWGQA